MWKKYLHSNLVIFKFVILSEPISLLFLFTFQSGDIQIRALSKNVTVIIEFTFQSGDIQILALL